MRGPNPKVLVVVNFFNVAMREPDMQGSTEELDENLREKFAQHLNFAVMKDMVIRAPLSLWRWGSREDHTPLISSQAQSQPSFPCITLQKQLEHELHLRCRASHSRPRNPPSLLQAGSEYACYLRPGSDSVHDWLRHHAVSTLAYRREGKSPFIFAKSASG
ncbi:hypothetical protein L7F22_054767 [Adiantum nelumboides]|nr:hypothetical protein [Adiantum nelumboides]